MYFLDTGLACWLLGWNTPEQMTSGAIILSEIGNIENFDNAFLFKTLTLSDDIWFDREVTDDEENE